jgi:hypothetical protein
MPSTGNKPYQATHLKCLPAGRTAPARSERSAVHLRTTFMNDTPFLEKRGERTLHPMTPAKCRANSGSPGRGLVEQARRKISPYPGVLPVQLLRTGRGTRARTEKSAECRYPGDVAPSQVVAAAKPGGVPAVKPAC